MLPYTPTMSHSRVAVMAVLLPMYSKMVVQYAALFLVSVAPDRMAAMPVATSKSMLTALKNERLMVVATNKAKGRTDAMGESPTFVVFEYC